MTEISPLPSSPFMDPERLSAVLTFLQAAEALKDTLRSGVTGQGRRESTAEHSWRLCLMVLLFESEMPEVDMTRLLKLCVLHDLGEAISGDIPATDQSAGDGRADRERTDLITLCASLPQDLRAEILDLWDEYAAGQTPEAVMAKGFDKLETMLQHQKGQRMQGFDYAFNLSYGRDRTDRHPLLRQIREVVDTGTRAAEAEKAAAEKAGAGKEAGTGKERP